MEFFYSSSVAFGFSIRHAEIAGINTYLGFGYSYGEIRMHIDFITRECHPIPFLWNRVNYNNGIAGRPNPWLCSDLYARLNSLATSVPGGEGAEGTPLIPVDYTITGGVLSTVPMELQNVIVQKKALISRRYTAGQLLDEDNEWDWEDIGKLWLPSEMEVFGTGMWGSNVSPKQGYATSFYQQYPLFAHNNKRVKRTADGTRHYWWLSTQRGGNESHCCFVSYYGAGGAFNTAAPNMYVPLCFRIA